MRPYVHSSRASGVAGGLLKPRNKARKSNKQKKGAKGKRGKKSGGANKGGDDGWARFLVRSLLIFLIVFGGLLGYRCWRIQQATGRWPDDVATVAAAEVANLGSLVRGLVGQVRDAAAAATGKAADEEVCTDDPPPPGTL